MEGHDQDVPTNQPPLDAEDLAPEPLNDAAAASCAATGEVARGTEGLFKPPGWISPQTIFLTSLSIPVLSLLIGVWHLRSSWDDGAITAAFARTFAHTGRIALTPVSEQVEGFSSVLWLLLLSVPALVTANPWLIVVWMKLCSAAAFLGSLLALRPIASRYLRSDFSVAGAVFLLAVTIAPFRETMNGMEMNLCMLLTLVLCGVLLASRSPWLQMVLATAISCLLLLTRFEAPYLLLFLYGGLLLSGASKRRILIVTIADALCFFMEEVWRYKVFHLWMPNTVYAKQWMPYQPPRTLHLLIRNRVDASSELLLIFGWPIAVLFVGWLLAGRPLKGELFRSGTQAHGAMLLVSMVGGGALFGLVFGQNWGHPGRMILGFLPFMVLSIVYITERAKVFGNYSRVRVFAVILLGQLLWWGRQAFIPAWHDSQVSIALLEREGKAANQIRLLLNKQTASVMIPDVGGAALCCENLEIHDVALLTNSYLARRGYAAFDEYARQVNPEIVEIHGMWSDLTKFYSNASLRNYGLVGAAGVRMLVRPDLYKALKAEGVAEVRIAETSACRDDLMDTNSNDEIFAGERGVCLLLPEP